MNYIKKIFAIVLIFALAIGPESSYAQGFSMVNLPEPGTMVTDSLAFVPVLVKGLIIHPDQPLNFEFLVDSGNDSPDQVLVQSESERMVRYFLAALTVPADQLWVNLSPFEKDRMIADDLGATDLGRDMLAQDYVLKQLTASLIYPEKQLGKEFWARVYQETQTKFATTDIPVDTFNKVWIVPQKAEVFENGNAVYVTGARLKVMLDSDYLAAAKDPGHSMQNTAGSQELAKQVVREVILPAIEREVNEGKNFAPLRQIYFAAILAKWYRETIANTLLDKVYVGQNKIAGVDVADKTVKEQIYQRYIAAYKKGVFNYIKEETDAATGETVPRKYFSGGISEFAMKDIPLARTDQKAVRKTGEVFSVAFALHKPDTATIQFSSAALAKNTQVKLPDAAMLVEVVVVVLAYFGIKALYDNFVKVNAEPQPDLQEREAVRMVLMEQAPVGTRDEEIERLLPAAMEIIARGNRFRVEERVAEHFETRKGPDGIYRATTDKPLSVTKRLIVAEYPPAVDFDAAMNSFTGEMVPEMDNRISGGFRYYEPEELYIGDSTTEKYAAAQHHINVQNFDLAKTRAELAAFKRSGYAQKTGLSQGGEYVIRIDVSDALMVPVATPKYHDAESASRGVFSAHEWALARRVAEQLTDVEDQKAFLDRFDLMFRIFSAIRRLPTGKTLTAEDIEGNRQLHLNFADTIRLLQDGAWEMVDANNQLTAPYAKRYELWTKALSFQGQRGSTVLRQEDIAAVSSEMVLNPNFVETDQLIREVLGINPVYQIVSGNIKQVMETESFNRQLADANIRLHQDILAPSLKATILTDAAMISEDLLRQAREDLNSFGIGDKTAIQFYAEALDRLKKSNSPGAFISIQQFASRLGKLLPQSNKEALANAIRKLAEEIRFPADRTAKLVADALPESVAAPVTKETATFGDYWASAGEIASLKARIGRLADIKENKVREQEVQTEAERLWGLHGIRSSNAHALFIAAFVELVSGRAESFQNMRKALIEQNFEARDSLKSLINSLSAVPLSDEEKLQVLVGEMMKVDDVTAAWLAASAIRGMTAKTDMEHAVQETVNTIFDTFPATYRDRAGFKLSVVRALSLVLRNGVDFKAYLFNNEVGIERVRETENPRERKTYRELLSDKAMADPAILSVWAANLPDPAALLAFVQSLGERVPPVVIQFGASVTLVTAFAYISNVWKRNKIKTSIEKLRDRGGELESRVAAAAYLTDVLAADKKKFLATRNAKEKDAYERELRNILWNLYLTGVNDPDYKVLRECIFGLAYFMEIQVIRDWLREIAERYKTANVGMNLQDAILKLKLLSDLEHDLELLDREWPNGGPPDNAMTFLTVTLAKAPGSTDLAMLDMNSLTAVSWLPVGTLALMLASYLMTRLNEGGVLIQEEVDIVDRVSRQGQTVVIGKQGFLEPESNFRFLFDAAYELLRSFTPSNEVLVDYNVKLAALEQWKHGKEVVLTAPPIKGVQGTASVELLQPIDSSQSPGGIDIKDIEVSKQNSGAGIRFDDQAVEKILQGGFDGFTPVIINITPVESPLPLLGVRQEAATVVKI